MSARHAGWLAPLALPGWALAAAGAPARAEPAASGMPGGVSHPAYRALIAAEESDFPG